MLVFEQLSSVLMANDYVCTIYTFTVLLICFLNWICLLLTHYLITVNIF